MELKLSCAAAICLSVGSSSSSSVSSSSRRRNLWPRARFEYMRDGWRVPGLGVM